MSEGGVEFDELTMIVNENKLYIKDKMAGADKSVEFDDYTIYQQGLLFVVVLTCQTKDCLISLIDKKVHYLYKDESFTSLKDLYHFSTVSLLYSIFKLSLILQLIIMR